MRASTLAAVVSLSILMGCATQPSQRPEYVELQNYISTNKPLAENGTMKWSEYYKGAYHLGRIANLPSDTLRRLNESIRDAELYESGRMTLSEFEYRRRAAQASQQAASEQRAEQERIRTRDAILAAAASFNAAQAQPTYQIVQPAPLTQPALQQPSLQLSPAVTAIWTGQQRQVQTVTYQMGWSCEYNYAGRTFWRTFVGTCPQTVQVQ
jgi:hypothetical protein